MWYFFFLPNLICQFDSSNIHVNYNVNALCSTSCFNVYSNSLPCENRSTVEMLNNIIATGNDTISMLNTNSAKDAEVRVGLGLVFVSRTAFSYRLINKPIHSARFVISLLLTRELHRCCCVNIHLVLTSKWPSVRTVSQC